MKHTRPHGAMLALLAFALVLLAWPALAADIGDQQDKSYIDVEKVFSGITQEQIPADFAIQITGNGTTHILTMDNVQTISTIDNGVSVIWREEGLSAGTYSIHESGQNIPGYSVEADGLGDERTITAAELTFSSTLVDVSKELGKGYKLLEGNIFVGNLTGAVGDGFVFITINTLNASEREAVIYWLENVINKRGKNYYFFSIEDQTTEIDSTFMIGNGVITYHYANGSITFDKTKLWSSADNATMGYTDTEASHADFQVTNTYTKQTLTVRKEVTGNLGSKSRSFDYTVTLPEMGGQPVTCRTNDTPGTLELDANGTGHFSLAHGQSITLEAVYGRYTVEEAATRGYTTTISTNGAEAAGQTSISGTIASGDTQIKFTNELEISPPTGVHDSVGYALVGLLLTAALWFITRIGGGYARHE